MNWINILKLEIHDIISLEFCNGLLTARFPAARFTCNSGKCIYKSNVCNGDDDCGDNSDKKNPILPFYLISRKIGVFSNNPGKHQSNGDI